MKLYSYFRSGTSHRLRIALALKGLHPDYVPVDLLHGEQAGAAYRAVNPQGLVPALEVDGQVLTQSPAIIEWLDETYPEPPLLPREPLLRARARALAAVVGCDMHPLNNRRVVEYLRAEFGCDTSAVNAWCGTWMGAGFDALNALLAADPARGRFCVGGRPGVAEVYLVPQMTTARRFQVDLSRWPRLLDIEAACLELQAFRDAAPAAQPDAPKP
ncbi:MAG: maleylacetoacetate isomerase [Betaproteobacteria bacterium]|nr:maleylacetoacetate isomerase [Betaproteobacteria bacterium]